MKIHIFLLNIKNELFVIKNINNKFIIPTFNEPINIIKDIFKKNYNIIFNIIKIYNNNYICSHNSSSYIKENEYSYIKFSYISNFTENLLYTNHAYTLNKIYPLLSNKKLNVILDIDKTLLETKFDNINTVHKYAPHFYFEIKYKKVGVWLRPNVHVFLQKISNFANIYYYTAGVKEVQEIVLTYCDLMKYCKNAFYRNSCFIYGSKYVKCLRSLNFDPDNTVLIDDNPDHLILNNYNTILINSWNYSEINDDSLNTILEILKDMIDHIFHENCTVQNFIKKNIFTPNNNLTPLI